MTDSHKPYVGVLALAMSFAAVLASTASAADEGASEAPYTVKCEASGSDCRVDMDTYIGWRTYNGNCARCHGAGGSGSSLAPNLMQRISRKNMSYQEFGEVVRNGVSGDMGVMPPWGANQNVMKRLDNLWAYLQARTDGVLAIGRPNKLEEEEEQTANRPANWE